MVVCLEQGADLHMAQLMPLPLTVSCFSKIQIGFNFLVPAHLGSPGKRAIIRVCVCVPGYIFKNSKRFLCDKPYYIRMQEKLVMSTNENVMMSSDQRSSLCHPTVQCTENHVTCKNYTANYKNFPGA